MEPTEPTQQNKPRPTKRMHRGRRWVLIGLGSLLLAGAAVVWGAMYLDEVTPGIGDMQKARMVQPSELRYADGKPMDIFRVVLQERVPLERISPNVVDALIATEDRRFYEHKGIDYRRTMSAVMHTLTGSQQGGSTITQQLVRNLFPEEIGRSRSIVRKLKEAATALKIERAYSKREILETYLNTVPFLYNVQGIEMAARTYFDKPAANLNVQEAATLVGMLKGTNYYNPVINPERATQRRNVVMQQMVKNGVLSESRYQQLQKKPLQVHFSRQNEKSGAHNHFALQVRKWLQDWAERNNFNLYEDGLIVTTTLDSSLQAEATRAVERQGALLQAVADLEWSRGSDAPAPVSLKGESAKKRSNAFQYFWSSRPDLVEAFIRETPEYRKAVDGGEKPASALRKLRQDKDFIDKLRAAKTRLEAGFLAIDPASGEIRAWVGSRDFQRDQFDHVVQAVRQPGSTFKPIVYGAALEHGISPGRRYRDTEINITLDNGSIWKPTDMNGPSERSMTLREGLIYSKNTITAQVMRDVGVPDVVRLAQAVGVNQSKLDPVPSLALGTSPVTLMEMVNAYTTIARQGMYRPPIFVKRITDRNGKVLAEFSSPGQRAMSQESADALIDIMRGVVDRGTGQAIRTRFDIRADVAGKTGTTQNNTDGWFILMHPNLVAGAWIGFNDTRVTMRSDYWGQGGHNAILIVGDFFQQALRSKKIDGGLRFTAEPYQAPPQVPWYVEANNNPGRGRNVFDEIGDRFRQWGGGDQTAARTARRPVEAPKFGD